MLAVRALAIDRDGTLLQPDGTLGDRDLRAVRAAAAAGWHVVLATARWHHEPNVSRTRSASTALSLLARGAGPPSQRRSGRVRPTSAFRIHCSPLRPLRYRRRHRYVYKDQDVLWRAADAAPRADLPELCPVRSLADAARTPRCALIIGEAFERVRACDVAARMAQQRPRPELDDRTRRERAHAHRSRCRQGCGLHVASAELGIDASEVVAFRDSVTDVEMFRVAGASVAMGQASQDVRDAATWVTTANTDHGVGRAIERLLDGLDPSA